MVQVRPLSEAMGAEVIGVDAARDPEGAYRTAHRAFLDHDGLVVLRDQELTPEQHIAFSRRFGDLIGRRNSVSNKVLLEGHPEILVLSNKKVNDEPIGLEKAGHYWHSDVTFEERPAMGSLLYALEIPPEGGDTEFANMYKAYEGLPEEVRRQVEGRTCEHSFAGSDDSYQVGGLRGEVSEEQKAAQQRSVAHPIVRTHPETGRKALYANPGYAKRIVGLPEEESKALLAFLFEHSVKPEYVYRHKWRRHDLLIWDNRCVIHAASGFDPRYTRHMHRTTVAGDRPF